MSAVCGIELLGGLRVRLKDNEITRFRTQKTASLLAYLALHLNRMHPREELVDRFWPDADLASGRMNLRTVLAALRRELEPDTSDSPDVPDSSEGILLADRQNVRLNPARVTTDARRFEEEVRRADRETETAEKITILSQAVALYRGPLLPGFYDDWVLSERERLQLLQVRALRDLVAALTAAGRMDDAVTYAYQVLELEPLDEESHADLMRLHAAAGRTAALTRQYREMERRLREEVDAAPSDELQALYHRLLRERPPLAVTARSGGTASAGVLAAMPSSLPAPLTRFFGREEEIARILRLLGEAKSETQATEETAPIRLVTLTGPGGSGKTRLAIEVGRRLTDRKDGPPVCFVALADVTRVDIALGVLLKALKAIPEAGADLREQVLRRLAPASGVLILDNFEQIADEGAELVRAVLEAAPHLRLLVTSRQRLDIGGEQELPVLPLPVPSLPGLAEALERIPSVQLFRDRARAVAPDFQITRENGAAVSAICERLDGIPLALELAAAWVQTLTPAQILARLDDRFQLLTSRRKDLPPRHRTLRSAIEWSVETLEPEARRFFARLSVFRGAWTLEAAEAVCEEPRALDLVSVLQERSLVLADPQGTQMRFRLLETLREYGQLQLPPEEQEELSHRHADYFQRFVKERHPLLQGADQGAILDQLEAEHDNLRAALEWSVAALGPEAAAIACSLGCTLFRFWTIRGYTVEGRRWLRQALTRTDEVPEGLRAETLYFAGSLALAHRDLTEAESLFTRALAGMRAAGDRYGVVNTICRLGLIQLGRQDLTGAEQTFREGLALARADGFLGSESHLLKCLGQTLREKGDYPQARVVLDQGLEVARAWGDPHGISMLYGEIGHLALQEGDLERAEPILREQLSLARQLKAAGHEARSLSTLAQLALQRHEWDQADTLFRESAAIYRHSGEMAELADTLLALATLGLRLEDAHPVSTALHEALEIYQQLGDAAALRRNLSLAAGLAALQGRFIDAARLWGAASPSPDTVEDVPGRLRQATVDAIGRDSFSREQEAGQRLTLDAALRLAFPPEEPRE